MQQIWIAVECNGAIYCTVVTSYCPRPKILLKPSFSRGLLGPREISSSSSSSSFITPEKAAVVIKGNKSTYKHKNSKHYTILVIYVGWRSNFRSRAIWRYYSAVNSTSARNKQSIFVLLSHHQKCTLTGEITASYFSWIVDKNSKNTSQFQLVAGSPIHLLAYFLLWRIHGVNENISTCKTFLRYFGITWQF